MKQNWIKLSLAMLIVAALLGAIALMQWSNSLSADNTLPTLAPTLEVAQAQAEVASDSTVLPTDAPPEPTATPTDLPTQALTATATTAPSATVTAAPSSPPQPTQAQAQATPPRVTVLQVSSAPPTEPVPNVVVLRVEAPQLAQLQADVTARGGTVEIVDPRLGAVTVQMPDEEAAEALASAAYVQASEPDYYVVSQALATDPLLPQQHSFTAMNIPLSLPDDLSLVTVAVIDSGVCQHPELEGKVLGGYDFVESDETPQDENGHGCAVSGIIAANWDGRGMAGIAPNARLLAYRVLNAQGSGRYSHVAAAITRAVDEGAQIINLSLGGANPSQLLRDAVSYATSRGVLVIAAAGNSGSSVALYPAAYPDVVSVGATNPDGTQASFSNTGKVDSWAPGAAVLSIDIAGDYRRFNGTSFAAPNVAGLAALEMAQGRSLTLGGVAVYGGMRELVITEPTSTPTIATLDPSQVIDINNWMDNSDFDLSKIREGYVLLGDMLVPLEALDVDALGNYQINTWPGGIVPYVFSSNVTASQRNVMLQAMSWWQSAAPITFVPRTNQADYLEIFNGNGNWSYVGRISGRQELSMSNWVVGIAAHELGHALGIWHEHQRPDRDNYVYIAYENILSGNTHDFNKVGTAYGPYDFLSIMHYSGTAFSTNGQRTIVARPGYEGYQSLMGQLSGLSEGDKRMAAFLYTPLALANTNLITNGDFSQGFNRWWVYESMDYAIYGNVLHFKRPNGVADSSIGQDIPWRVTNGSGLELSFDVGNTSNVTKNFHVALRSATGWDNALTCEFSVPPRTPLRRYVITGSSREWIGMKIEFRVNADGQPDAMLDNVSLIHRSTLNNTPTTCAWAQAPANTNLVANSTFDTIDNWYASGVLNFTITNGYAQLNSKGADWGALYQNLFYSAAANHAFEITFRVQNTGTAPRELTASLKNIDSWANSISCTFNVPATNSFLSYTMRGRFPQAVPGMTIQFDPARFETSPNMRIDDVVVQYRPSLSVSGTECISPSLTTPSAPVITAPTVTVTNNNRPTVSWNSVTDATSYVVDFLLGSTVSHSATVTTTSYTPPTGLPDGAYNIRVRGLNVLGQAGPNSTARSLTIDTVPPAVPAHIAPAANASLTTFTPTFSWTAPSGATGYELRYGFTSTPNWPVNNLTTTSYTLPQALTVGTVFWQVRARDAAGNWSVWSNPTSFNVDSPANAVPRAVRYPATDTTLTWNPQDWAQGYEVQVATNSTFTNVVHQTANLPAGTWQLTVMLPEGTYFWRVRMRVSATAWSPWSEVGTLIVR